MPRADERSFAYIALIVFFGVTGLGEAAMGTLVAPFVRDLLGGSATGYGVFLGVQAVGGLAGGAVLTAVAHRLPVRTLLGWGSVVLGAGDLLLFLSTLVLPAPLGVAVVLIGLVGLPAAAVSAGVATLFQRAVPDASRGAVFGTLTALQSAAMLVGTPLAGIGAQALGIVPVIVVQAGAYLAAGATALALLRRGRASPEAVVA